MSEAVARRKVSLRELYLSEVGYDIGDWHYKVHANHLAQSLFIYRYEQGVDVEIWRGGLDEYTRFEGGNMKDFVQHIVKGVDNGNLRS